MSCNSGGAYLLAFRRPPLLVWTICAEQHLAVGLQVTKASCDNEVRTPLLQNEERGMTTQVAEHGNSGR